MRTALVNEAATAIIRGERWIAKNYSVLLPATRERLATQSVEAVISGVHFLSKENLVRTADAILKVAASLSAASVDRLIETLLPRYAKERQGGLLPDWCLDGVRLLTGSTLGYAQEGEDVLLERWLPPSEPGFFVDVGAHHPIRFSNTFALYRKGWRGINIDATPGCMEAFRSVRPEDTNVECAVSDKSTSLPFHIFVEVALNTFDTDLAHTYVKAGWELKEVRQITPQPLSVLLDKYWPVGRTMKLMNIDVEGLEMNVLRSNNWEKYRPEWMILELIDTPLQALAQHPCCVFLRKRGYAVVSKLAQSVVLREA